MQLFGGHSRITGMEAQPERFVVQLRTPSVPHVALLPGEVQVTRGVLQTKRQALCKVPGGARHAEQQVRSGPASSLSEQPAF